jgi:hypothetical protein
MLLALLAFVFVAHAQSSFFIFFFFFKFNQSEAWFSNEVFYSRDGRTSDTKFNRNEDSIRDVELHVSVIDVVFFQCILIENFIIKRRIPTSWCQEVWIGPRPSHNKIFQLRRVRWEQKLTSKNQLLKSTDLCYSGFFWLDDSPISTQINPFLFHSFPYFFLLFFFLPFFHFHFFYFFFSLFIIFPFLLFLLLFF